MNKTPHSTTKFYIVDYPLTEVSPDELEGAELVAAQNAVLAETIEDDALAAYNRLAHYQKAASNLTISDVPQAIRIQKRLERLHGALAYLEIYLKVDPSSDEVVDLKARIADAEKELAEVLP